MTEMLFCKVLDPVQYGLSDAHFSYTSQIIKTKLWTILSSYIIYFLYCIIKLVRK